MRGSNVTITDQGYQDGTTITKAHVNHVVKIVGWDSRHGPELELVATGANATDQVGWAVIQLVESAATKRAPNPFSAITVGMGPRVYVKKSRGNPDSTDVGRFAIFDVDTANNPIAGAVITDANATSGFGLVVDITGETANDWLVVNTEIRTR